MHPELNQPSNLKFKDKFGQQIWTESKSDEKIGLIQNLAMKLVLFKIWQWNWSNSKSGDEIVFWIKDDVD